uniref:Sulfhydryl oxidase n=1 Tax=Latimeria chalumnae TaxID=7897 RepID=H3A722_LATCH
DVQTLRHKIIDLLETHEDVWPPACPPLEPASMAEVRSFFQTNSVHYLALIFEEEDSYIGREVTLDMLQYENIAVRRVWRTEKAMVSQFGVKSFPSCYLYFNNGTHAQIQVEMQVRSFYTYYLQRLPGVMRGGYKLMVIPDSQSGAIATTWKTFDSSKVYMADLESALHYALRVEVKPQRILAGEELAALKGFVSVLAKYFPGRPTVKNLLRSMDSWLGSYRVSELSYSTFQDVVNNKLEVPSAVLADSVNWVGCQGSKPQFRGYPCSLWTLFHVLTVQAAWKLLPGNKGGNPLEVLLAMHGYVKYFFGCRDCATKFEAMAAESMENIKDLDGAILWLWSRHNRVNSRLAGAVSEDPKFPKLQWPPPDLCPKCHNEVKGEHVWNMDAVLRFLKAHFYKENISYDYLAREAHLLADQRDQLAAWREAEQQKQLRERKEKIKEENEKGQNELEKEEQRKEEEEEEEEEDEDDERNEQPEEGDETNVENVKQSRNPKPSFVQGKRKKKLQEEEIIVDLDSFIEHHYKSKALQAAAVRRNKGQREEQRQDQQVQQDAEMIDYREGLVPKKKHWIMLLGVGFSRLDLSLCVLFYFLSSLCLLGMCLYFRMRLKCRRARHTYN